MSIKKICVCDMCGQDKLNCDVYGFNVVRGCLSKSTEMLIADKHICKTCMIVIKVGQSSVDESNLS